MTKLVITEEMIGLFARGRKLQALGHGDDDEFDAISKRLDWALLKRLGHEVSVFDDLSGDPPPYMTARNTSAWPDFNGWFSGRAIQEALEAALKAANQGGTLPCRKPRRASRSPGIAGASREEKICGG
jgi:hypothetical protein